MTMTDAWLAATADDILVIPDCGRGEEWVVLDSCRRTGKSPVLVYSGLTHAAAELARAEVLGCLEQGSYYGPSEVLPAHFELHAALLAFFRDKGVSDPEAMAQDLMGLAPWRSLVSDDEHRDAGGIPF